MACQAFATYIVQFQHVFSHNTAWQSLPNPMFVSPFTALPVHHLYGWSGLARAGPVLRRLGSLLWQGGGGLDGPELFIKARGCEHWSLCVEDMSAGVRDVSAGRADCLLHCKRAALFRFRFRPALDGRTGVCVL
jgi:hypothetical protein